MPVGDGSPVPQDLEKLRKSNLTVPMYADGFDLLVFGASLTPLKNRLCFRTVRFFAAS